MQLARKVMSVLLVRRGLLAPPAQLVRLDPLVRLVPPDLRGQLVLQVRLVLSARLDPLARQVMLALLALQVRQVRKVLLAQLGLLVLLGLKASLVRQAQLVLRVTQA